MAEEKKLPFELQEGEEVLREFASDYWERFAFMYSQKRGRYYMTNRRVIFVYFGDVMLDLPYAEMESAEFCNIGALLKLIPTGIKVTMKDGKKHDLSVVKRKEILEIIKLNMQ